MSDPVIGVPDPPSMNAGFDNHSSVTVAANRSFRSVLWAHIEIARFDHAIKNVFVLPGIVVAVTLAHVAWTRHTAWTVFVGLVATTLIACSNYVINEVLDAPFDRLHPTKKSRPVACGRVYVPAAYLQWIGMMIVGMWIAVRISTPFALSAAALWIMGCLYNIRPFRTKDVVYLDVLTESVNNPLRMLLGWYMITTVIVPPVSLLISYWMVGCYFMALKRFSELREIGSKIDPGTYRASFKHYTQRSLLSSVVFYASAAMLFFGAFAMRYRLELILAFPFVAWVMAVYFDLAFQPDSAAQNPEKLYRQPLLVFSCVIAVIAIACLLTLPIPRLSKTFTPTMPPAYQPSSTPAAR